MYWAPDYRTIIQHQPSAFMRAVLTVNKFVKWRHVHKLAQCHFSPMPSPMLLGGLCLLSPCSFWVSLSRGSLSLVPMFFLGVSAQAVLCSVDLCHVGLCPGGLWLGFSVQGGVFPGGSLQGGLCPGVPFGETSKTDPSRHMVKSWRYTFYLNVFFFD